MLESLENLKAALKDLPQENLQALLAEVTASSQGAVAIARNATGAKIVTGSENILGDNNRLLIHQGMDAETLKLVLQEVLAAQRVYFYGLPETQPQTQVIAQAIREEINKSVPSQPIEVTSVDELVQQVRSRIHDDTQRLHGTMPLWGVDHWVPLSELFVDVNILEELSSSRRSELDNRWQDFSKNPSYRSLDRIGLGRERQRVSGLAVLAKHTNLMEIALHLARDVELAQFLKVAQTNPELQQELQLFRETLPNSRDWQIFEQWWSNNGQNWVEQLRMAMAAYKNLAADLQLTEEQTEQVQQYYDANKLLVDCIASSGTVSDAVKQNIEEMFLLPTSNTDQ